MKRFLTTTSAAVALCLMPMAASAEGNLAALPTDLQLDIDTRTLTFSETEFHLETGKYYRLEITSDGYEQLTFQSPELFRNSWIGQVQIDDTEVQLGGGLYGIGFDDEGDAVIFFVPIRPGNFDFYVSGYEDRGLRGTFVVR